MASSETEAVVELAKKSFGTVPAQVIDLPDGRTFAITRNDFKLDNITQPNKATVMLPKLVTQTVRIQTADSLIEYANRFKNDNSLVFADINNNSFHVAVDYHGRPDEDGKPEPQLTKHNAMLHLPFSEQWKVWTGADECMMGHIEFASHLEENAIDVSSPAGAELYEMIRDMQVKQDMHFGGSIRMGDYVSISYSKDEDATTKANMELPAWFDLHIPVYFDEEMVMIRCVMRRKTTSDGKLLLGYKMMRLEVARQSEFHRVAGEVAGSTGLPVVYGAITV